MAGTTTTRSQINKNLAWLLCSAPLSLAIAITITIVLDWVILLMPRVHFDPHEHGNMMPIKPSVQLEQVG